MSPRGSPLSLKTNYNGDIRRFTEPANISLRALEEHIASLYGLKTADPSSVLLKYKDEEGDLVTMASDSDLLAAVAYLAAIGETLLNVAVYDASENVTAATAIVANTPVSANVVTNAPETVVPVVASPVTTVPISDINTVAESPLSGNVTTQVPISDVISNVSPFTESPIVTTTVADSPITTNVVNVSGVDINVGNGNVDAAAQVFPFVNVTNLNAFMPFLYQLRSMGFSDTRKAIDLLNSYRGNYLQVLSHLVQTKRAGQQ